MFSSWDIFPQLDEKWLIKVDLCYQEEREREKIISDQQARNIIRGAARHGKRKRRCWRKDARGRERMKI